jgi:Zn-dependent protease with chaperone function/type II secretory pathway pseudopilin PulG
LEALVYPRERTLGAITLVLGVLIWVVAVAGTFGLLLVYLLLGFIGYVFAQSALIAYIRNTGVQISPQQLPDLHERFMHCSEKLGISPPPEAYVLQGGGMLNAFAARFLGKHFVVLLSDVVDALEAEPEGLNFYIGHELGHIRMKHFTGHLWRWPVLWLPLVGAAYARAKESTCDLHGRACCDNPEAAARALAVLGAGSKRWRSVDLRHYAQQAKEHNGFWAGFHELVGGYPWLTKRVARVMKPDVRMPGRNPLAYVLALFVPYGGRLGGAAGPVILVAIIGILAAVALPAYHDYQQRAKTSVLWQHGEAVRDTLGRYYAANGRVPASLDEAGLSGQLADGSTLEYDAHTMTVTVQTPGGELRMAPRPEEGGRIRWYCLPGDGLKASALPKACQPGAAAR